MRTAVVKRLVQEVVLLADIETTSLRCRAARRYLHEVPKGATESTAGGSTLPRLPERGAAVMDATANFLRNGAKGGAGALNGVLGGARAAASSLPSLPRDLRQAIGLQLTAFYTRHFTKILLGGGVLSMYMLWRGAYSLASVFVAFETSLVEYEFLALSIACTALGAVYVKRRLDISPDAVYRRAMLRLNTDPTVLNRMGPPLVGSEVRATVVTGGHFSLGKGMVPKWRAKRCQMIFPLTGADRRGLVSVEAKKWRGHLVFKLLAVDVRDGQGSREEQRVFLEGDSTVYERGGVMRELRDPFLHALDLEAGAYAREDLEDEQREEQAEAEAEERARPKSMAQGGGMFFYERVYYGVRDTVVRAVAAVDGLVNRGPASAK